MGPLRRGFPLTRSVFLVDTGSNSILEYQLQYSMCPLRGGIQRRVAHEDPPPAKESFSNGK